MLTAISQRTTRLQKSGSWSRQWARSKAVRVHRCWP